MKTYFINDNTGEWESCVLQCSCVGHCSYLSFIKSDIILNRFYIDIVTYNTDKQEDIINMQNNVYLTSAKIKELHDQLKEIDYDKSVLVVLNKVSKKDKLEYFILITKDNGYNISFMSRKYKKAYKEIFDIILTEDMLNKFKDVLSTWISG